MRVTQVTTASIRLGIYARHCVPCCYITIHFPEFEEVTKPPSLAGLAAIAYIPKKSSNCYGKSEIPYCPAELAN